MNAVPAVCLCAGLRGHLAGPRSAFAAVFLALFDGLRLLLMTVRDKKDYTIRLLQGLGCLPIQDKDHRASVQYYMIKLLTSILRGMAAFSCSDRNLNVDSSRLACSIWSCSSWNCFISDAARLW